LGELVINELYRSELRLYKNFFQPVMKLVSKERIGGSLKRKYDTPKTPYQRLMDSGQISEQTRKQLKTVYLSLNPAQLKRSIDAKLDERTYEEKRKSQQVNPMRKVVPHTVTSFMIQQPKVGLPT
ncbi:transposase, partial [Dehalococcoidia bacterium]|nr:transposase [Dehalococcoidia bacterium]